MGILMENIADESNAPELDILYFLCYITIKNGGFNRN